MLNSNGYKMIFFLENVLREYLTEFSEPSDISTTVLAEAEKNAVNNGIELPIPYGTLLKYLHLGQLLDSIKSINRKKRNNILNVKYGLLIQLRNNIMHSRIIGYDELEKIEEQCMTIIEALSEDRYLAKWHQFLTVDIENYEVPLVYLEYPGGKNFDKLIGRDKELRNLKEELTIPAPISVIGIGGLGKTALVLQLIEDLMYSPDRPFDRIYLMSFKNTMFEHGETKRFEKNISNHKDLIYKLAYYMAIDIKDKTFEDVESLVWDNIFDKSTLLILDNLETEIVQSNLAEFSDIARKFMKKHLSPSRLIITSRYGLGERDNPYPLNHFDVEGTKQLLYFFMKDQRTKLNNISAEDWEWIQKTSFGNPGLIISLSNTLRTSIKTIKDIRIDYETDYTSEVTEIVEQTQEFMRFCFENTIESMPKETQIYLAILCFICADTNTYQINEELLNFIKEELRLNKLYGDRYLRSQLLVNIGFCQKIKDSSYYTVNELIVEYINGNFSEDVFNVFSLKQAEIFKEVLSLTELFNDIQFDKDMNLPELLSSIYSSKFRVSKDIKYMIKAFQSNPSIDTLIYLYEKSEPIGIYNNFLLIDKLTARELNDTRLAQKQQTLIRLIVNSLKEIKKQLMKERNNTQKTTSIRSSELYKTFQQLEKKFACMKTKILDIQTRIYICNFLIGARELQHAENYLIEDRAMQKTKCEIYVNQIGELAGKNPEECGNYLEKLKHIDWSKIRDDFLYKKYLIFSARYYRHTPETCLTNVNKFIQLCRITPTERDMSMYSFYLESLLLKAQSLYTTKGAVTEVSELIRNFKKQIGTIAYKKLTFKKKEEFEKTLERLEGLIYKVG
ncbi:hypothetical protein [Paenibacillus silviterrae]|uniref:hypothetical protein n=1 Tax=Paenibacillus silviterrae TaxID=3242194 RepID=UPI002542D3F5|nr:hypothetical protein [Paenibacillus chinjuensis]